MNVWFIELFLLGLIKTHKRKCFKVWFLHMITLEILMWNAGRHLWLLLNLLAHSRCRSIMLPFPVHWGQKLTSIHCYTLAQMQTPRHSLTWQLSHHTQSNTMVLHTNTRHCMTRVTSTRRVRHTWSLTEDTTLSSFFLCLCSSHYSITASSSSRTAFCGLAGLFPLSTRYIHVLVEHIFIQHPLPGRLCWTLRLKVCISHTHFSPLGGCILFSGDRNKQKPVNKYHLRTWKIKANFHLQDAFFILLSIHSASIKYLLPARKHIRDWE